jgi:sulfur-oxidizing protein SoxZ
MADTAKVRTLIHLPEGLRKDQPTEVRATLGHPMENGMRADGHGNVVPHNLVTRFECQHDGVLVCSIDLFAADANEYLALAAWLALRAAGMLVETPTLPP